MLKLNLTPGLKTRTLPELFDISKEAEEKISKFLFEVAFYPEKYAHLCNENKELVLGLIIEHYQTKIATSNNEIGFFLYIVESSLSMALKLRGLYETNNQDPLKGSLFQKLMGFPQRGNS